MGYGSALSYHGDSGPVKPNRSFSTSWLLFSEVTLEELGQGDRRDGDPRGHMVSMSHKVPQSLLQLRVPAWKELCWPSWPAYLAKAALPWDSHSQHQRVPKDSWGWLSSLLSALWLLPTAAFEAQSICPMGTPSGCLEILFLPLFQFC